MDFLWVEGAEGLGAVGRGGCGSRGCGSRGLWVEGRRSRVVGEGSRGSRGV